MGCKPAAYLTAHIHVGTNRSDSLSSEDSGLVDYSRFGPPWDIDDECTEYIS
jgi:hypothetical protein